MLKELRLKKGITIEKLSDLAGVHKQRISVIENNESYAKPEEIKVLIEQLSALPDNVPSAMSLSKSRGRARSVAEYQEDLRNLLMDHPDDKEKIRSLKRRISHAKCREKNKEDLRQ